MVPAGLQVYERRPEPKNDAVDTGRAYIIIVIPRGQAALKEVSGSWQHIIRLHSRSTMHVRCSHSHVYQLITQYRCPDACKQSVVQHMFSNASQVHNGVARFWHCVHCT
jgi:hypothetical protein